MKPVRGATTVQLRATVVALLVCLAVARPLLVAARGMTTPARTSLPPCKLLNVPKDLVHMHPTDLAVVAQGYRCLLRHYITASQLDDRVLLQGAFKAMTQAFGAYAAGITLPPLTGDRDTDWHAFASAYQALAARFKPVPAIQQLLAENSLLGMAGSLHDDHTGYLPPEQMQGEIAQLNPGVAAPTLGFVTSPLTDTTTTIYITDVFAGTPAAANLRPGDILESENGHALIVQGQPDVNALFALLFPRLGHPVTLTILRPRTGARFPVTLTPRSLVTPATTTRVLAGDIAYVKLYAFTTSAAHQVFSAIKGLDLGASLRGVILDLRGDGGGDKDQAIRIISAFVHNAIVGYEVNGRGHRAAQRTDNRVSLLHKPIVVLIDAGSASSSELVAGAVRDYHLGMLVGTRTAGAIAGAEFYGLSDGSGLEVTVDRVLGPLGEKVDGVGIAPNQQYITTAADLSAGRDPVIDEAVRDIKRATGSL